MIDPHEIVKCWYCDDRVEMHETLDYDEALFCSDQCIDDYRYDVSAEHHWDNG